MSQISIALSLAGVSFLFTVIWGEPLRRRLRHYKIGEKIQIHSPTQDFTKLGTPTMGGLLVILPVTILTLLLNLVSLVGPDVLLGRSILLPLIVMISFGGLGILSDWRRARGIHEKGLRFRTKLVIQLVLAFITAYILRFLLDVPEMYLPFYPGEFELGYWFILFSILVIMGAVNSMNLTSGVDGLTGLVAATAFSAYGAIAILQGQIFIVRFCFTLVGSLLGFLWFGVKPASLMLGYTGTYALGATLAVIALMTAQWPLLPLIAIIPMSEAVSVILQIGYFRWTRGRRLFRMAPLHYHYELTGWSETQIVQRFWLINFLFAMIAITLALV